MTISYGIMVLAALAWLFILFAAAHGCGTWVLKRLCLQKKDSPGDAVIAIGIGMAVFSYMIFLLAALGLLSKPVLFGAAALWSLWLVPELLGRLRRGTACLDTNGRGTARRAPTYIGWSLFALLALLNFIPAFVPETGWDGMAYHLALPKLYLQAGGFVFRPDIFHNLFPQFTEMFYLAGMIFPYGMAAKGVHFAFGGLVVFILYCLGKELENPLAGLLAGLIFYAQYVVHMESTTAFIDLTVAAYAALGLLAVFKFIQSRDMRWLYMTAFFLGIIAANKWHGLIVLVLAGGAILLMIWNRKSLRLQEKLRQSAGVMGWGSLPVLPYMIRAWMMGGNPAWPLLYPVFGGKYWDARIADQVQKLHASFAGGDHGFLGLIQLPYDLIVRGSLFGLGGAELRWPLVGMLFIVICTLFFLRWDYQASPYRLQGIQKITLPGIMGLFVIIWFFSSPQIRFLMPLFPVAAWLAGLVLVALWKQGTTVNRLLAVSIGMLFFLFHPPIHHDTGRQVKVLANRVPPDIYCHQKIDHYAAMRFLNKNVRAGEKVLLFGENRGFYLEVDYLWGDPMMQMVIDYRKFESAGEAGRSPLLRELHNHNVRWVLFRTDLYAETYLDPKIVTMMEAVLTSAGEKQFEDGPVSVYKIYADRQLALIR
ncbi:glycosyltransferase family 39 protein [bacterium]|nr:glycosyltransferase family 39 protein [bacterium]